MFLDWGQGAHRAAEEGDQPLWKGKRFAGIGSLVNRWLCRFLCKVIASERSVAEVAITSKDCRRP